MEIRTATADDWPRIIEIYNHAVIDGHATADLRPLSVDERRSWLELHNDRYPIRVAVESGTIVGWCSLSPWRPGREALKRVAEVSYYTAREARGKGIAGLLMEDAFEHAANHDFRHLIAILLEINHPSLNLLRKYGFSRWGEFPGIADLGDLNCGQLVYGKELSGRFAPAARLVATL